MKNHGWIAILLATLFTMAGATDAEGGQVSLNPPFHSETLSYSATVSHGTDEVTMVASPHYSDARVTVNGGNPNKPVQLVEGENTIEVVVTYGGSLRTYTVVVTREAAAETRQPPPDTQQPPPNTGGTGTGGGGGGGGGLPPPVSGNEPPPSTNEEPSTPCPREDKEILANFYQMTDGEGWERDDNWNSEEPLGEWFGVKTDEDGNVVSLRLADNGLSGDMPARELRCLEDKELVELALWDNDDLSGEVPDELVLAVERAALRYLAETLDVNPGWFEDYEDPPYAFEDWHEGVTIDDDGRVTEIDLTGERVTGEIPENIRELLPRLGGITVTRISGDGGCALSPEGSSAFGLFLLALVVFAALVRKRARG